MIHIHREDQAKEFFDKLYEDGLLYHPEDDAYDICNSEGPLFTLTEADLLNERMDEVYRVLEDPCEYVLKLISD